MAFNGHVAAGRCDLRLGKHEYHNHKSGMAPQEDGGRVVVTCDLGSMITTIIRRHGSPRRVTALFILRIIPQAKETAPPGAVLRT